MQELFNTFNSLSQACRYYGFHVNKKGLDKVKLMVKENNIDISHFRPNEKEKKYEIIEKECPVCLTLFTTQKGHQREKQTCSYACSNTRFRSGINNPNFGKLIGNGDCNTHYRTVCFHYHKKECIICSENKIVSVHHYDNNHKNNEPKNLVPLCPTHHQYVHSRYQNEIQHIIDNYVKNFEKNILPLYYEKIT